MSLQKKIAEIRALFPYTSGNRYASRKAPLSELQQIGYIGGGVSRRVFLYKSIVIKFDVESGVSNRKEYENWKIISKTKSKNFFAKVLWISKDSLVLIAEYIKGVHPIGWPTPIMTEEEKYRYKRLRYMSNHCYKNFKIVDLHAGNVVFKGRMPKVVDYAE